MTAIVAWSTSDGKPGAASLYLASDSRITSRRADGSVDVLRDDFQKVFPSPITPDVFAICGPIVGLDSFVADLYRSADQLRREKSYAGAPDVFSEELFHHMSNARDVRPHEGLTIFHGYRFGSRDLRLSVAKCVGGSVSLSHCALRATGGLLASDGKGEAMVREVQGEYLESESDSKEFSRWFWMSFCASLSPSRHVTCGGPPQLVALFSKDSGIALGTYFAGAASLFGKATDRSDIEYRDDLFQRVDRFGILLPNAQPHARKLAAPRIFDFAQ